MVRIAKMVCDCTTFINTLLEVMSRYVARSFAVVGVINVSATGMRDLRDLAYSAAVVVCGALVGIRHRIDKPIGVITQMRTVPSKIGVAQ